MSQKRIKSLRVIATDIFDKEKKYSGIAGGQYVSIEGQYYNWNQFFKKFKKEYKEGVYVDDKKDIQKKSKKTYEKKPEKESNKEEKSC